MVSSITWTALANQIPSSPSCLHAGSPLSTADTHHNQWLGHAAPAGGCPLSGGCHPSAVCTPCVTPLLYYHTYIIDSSAAILWGCQIDLPPGPYMPLSAHKTGATLKVALHQLVDSVPIVKDFKNQEDWLSYHQAKLPEDKQM